MSTHKNLFSHLRESVFHTLKVWIREYQLILSDVGVMIIIFAVPLVYPLLYSLIYYPEVVRDLPVAVADLSRTSESRSFIRDLNATADLEVNQICTSMEEATQLFREREVRGIVLIPGDFTDKLAKGEQAVISAYADMEFFLYYKALMTGVNFVALQKGYDIQLEKLMEAGLTEAEADHQAEPIALIDNAMANRAGGFASYGIPAALILIIQQTLVLAIGIMAGTARERHPFATLVSLDKNRFGIFRQVIGKTAAYFSIYAVLAVYMLGLIPHWFGYEHRAGLTELVMLVTPFILASVFMGMSLSVLFKSRESAMMLYLFSSIPLLFLSGIIWPLSNFDLPWLILRQAFPSSNAMLGFIKMNSLGATLSETLPEIKALWIQTATYCLLACTVYAYQIRKAENLRNELRKQPFRQIRAKIRELTLNHQQ